MPCFYPVAIPRPDGTHIPVPCGRCIGCKIDRTRLIALRCVHESKSHLYNSFVTLTYNNNNLPLTPSNLPTLNKSQLQLFIKRQRMSYHRDQQGTFRYLAGGEYGDQYSRPHYHLCLFGIDYSYDRYPVEMSLDGNHQYNSPTLTKVWPYGNHLITDFTFDTAAYTASYCLKKQSGENTKLYQDREPEFGLMSLKPGLGAAHYYRYHDDWYNGDYCVNNGFQLKLPRYYDKLLERTDPARYEKIKTERSKKIPEIENLSRRYDRAVLRFVKQDKKMRKYEKRIMSREEFKHANSNIFSP